MDLNPAAKVLRSAWVALVGCTRSVSVVLACCSANPPIQDEWLAIRKLTRNQLRRLLALRAGPAYDSKLLFSADSHQWFSSQAVTEREGCGPDRPGRSPDEPGRVRIRTKNEIRRGGGRAVGR